jgi:hypothetical protein
VELYLRYLVHVHNVHKDGLTFTLPNFTLTCAIIVRSSLMFKSQPILPLIYFLPYLHYASLPTCISFTYLNRNIYHIATRAADLDCRMMKALYDFRETTPRRVRYFHGCHDYLPEITNTLPSHRIVKMPYTTHYFTRRKITRTFLPVPDITHH